MVGLLEKRSSAILFQEGQYAYGLNTLLNSVYASNIDTVLISAQQILSYQKSNYLKGSYPVYELTNSETGKSIKLLQYNILPQWEAEHLHSWTFMFDGEIVAETDTDDDADDSDSDGTTAQRPDDSKNGDDLENGQEGEASSGPAQGEEGDNLDQEGLGQVLAPYGHGRPGEDMPWEEGEESDVSQGRGKSEGQRMSPYKLERTKGPAIQERMMVTPKDDYNTHIRSVTKIGKATLPEEDVTRPYQQELESILQKEDMPLNYREYIKNYFISIGLRKGEKRNDTTR